METLLVFLAIVVIQMLAAYAKQKKEAAKKANAPTPEPFQEEEPEFEFKPRYEFEPKPALEQELPHHHTPLPAHPVIVADTPPKGRGAQGILWTAILSEPRYKVKWRQR